MANITGSYHINVTGDCAARMKSLRITQGGRDIRDGNDNMTQELVLMTILEPYSFEVTARDPQRMKYIKDTYNQSSTTLSFIEVNPQSTVNTLITLSECRILGFEDGVGWGDLQQSVIRGMCNTVTYADTTGVTMTPLTYTIT